MNSCLSHFGGGGGFNTFYLYQIFVLDYVVVKAQKMFGLHGKTHGFVMVTQVPVCWKKVFINLSMQHLQNIVSFNFLYLQKNDLPKV